uniref:Uncharacterized protein n=1 Tax=Amphimedon queenslandica TaxID=400682 RepID=A0A1X7SL50_AMPQE
IPPISWIQTTVEQYKFKKLDESCHKRRSRNKKTQGNLTTCK